MSATKWRQSFWHLTEVPQNIPTSTTNLHLNYNNITKLKRNDFAQLTMLQSLWLQENCLTEIEDGAFNGLEKLEVLWLANNCLEELRDGMLSGLNSLKSLNLGYNKLSNIDSETFVAVPRPLEINLWGNNLRCDDGLRRFQNEIDAGTIMSVPTRLVDKFCNNASLDYTHGPYPLENDGIDCKCTDSTECFHFLSVKICKFFIYWSSLPTNILVFHDTHF